MCEFCNNEKDIIFPFQLHKCQRCEGEHALLGPGLVGSRGPLPRPSFPLTWRDWLISKPRRLSNVLSRDMREGEGGEQFQVFTYGDKGDAEEEVEEVGEAELEQEVKKHEKGGEDGGGWQNRRVRSKLGPMLGERRVQREPNLLKTLHLGRLKKCLARDGGGKSMESREEKRHFWDVPKLKVFSKSSPRTDREDRGKRGANEDEEGMELRDEKEARPLTEVQEALDETARTERSSTEKLCVQQKVPAVLSRGRREEQEEDRNPESNGETDAAAEEGGATIITRKTWRGRRTRRARRISRGRKMRGVTERESKSEGGKSIEGAAGAKESVLDQAKRQREEG